MFVDTNGLPSLHVLAWLYRTTLAPQSILIPRYDPFGACYFHCSMGRSFLTVSRRMFVHSNPPAAAAAAATQLSRSRCFSRLNLRSDARNLITPHARIVSWRVYCCAFARSRRDCFESTRPSHTTRTNPNLYAYIFQKRSLEAGMCNADN